MLFQNNAKIKNYETKAYKYQQLVDKVKARKYFLLKRFELK